MTPEESLRPYLVEAAAKMGLDMPIDQLAMIAEKQIVGKYVRVDDYGDYDEFLVKDVVGLAFGWQRTTDDIARYKEDDWGNQDFMVSSMDPEDVCAYARQYLEGGARLENLERLPHQTCDHIGRCNCIWSMNFKRR